MRELKTLTGRTVIVATSETAIRGVVESATRSFVTLVEAESLEESQPVKIAGFVLVPVPRVVYVQVVPR
ncbi:hypothetical protein [Agromyces larvae]|uniref:Uncharacterized protein n=1 Tax=Agromyces larvae TaxID=2929802 RepID=A0ABY4C4Y0_9MICO|nr:hypothetical protein [Agromyces larvae]UOE45482.1 hypothetical protein MTO99_06915 [Agromyces larvae]